MLREVLAAPSALAMAIPWPAIAAPGTASAPADIPLVLLITAAGVLVFGVILLTARSRARKNQRD